MDTEQQNTQPNTDPMITYMPHNLYEAQQKQKQQGQDSQQSQGSQQAQGSQQSQGSQQAQGSQQSQGSQQPQPGFQPAQVTRNTQDPHQTSQNYSRKATSKGGTQEDLGSQQNQGSQQSQSSQQSQGFGQNTSENFGPNNIQNTVHNISPNKPQQYPNPGLSEREIQEIISSSGMVNGVVTDGIKLASAIADIIAKNNQLLIQAIQSGNYNQKPYDDKDGSHQVAAPTQMWEAGLRPQSGMPAPDTKTNNPYSQQSGQNQQNQQSH